MLLINSHTFMRLPFFAPYVKTSLAQAKSELRPLLTWLDDSIIVDQAWARTSEDMKNRQSHLVFIWTRCKPEQYVQ